MTPHRHPGPYPGKLRILNRIVVWSIVALAGVLVLVAPAFDREESLLHACRSATYVLAAVVGAWAFIGRGLRPWYYAGIPLVAAASLFVDPPSPALGALVLAVSMILDSRRGPARGLSTGQALRRIPEWHTPYEYLMHAGFLGLLAWLITSDGTRLGLWFDRSLDLATALSFVFAAFAIVRPAMRRPPLTPETASTMPAIVSSGGSPAAVTIVQSLGPRGIPIHALSNLDHPACLYSRYTTTCHITESGRGGGPRHDNVQEPDSLVTYLERHVERGVLFPGTDANIRFLARHKRRLTDAGFRMCIPDADVLAHAANKSDLATFCTRHGFPAPRTVIVDSAEDLARVAELQFPVVLKGVFMKNHRFVERRADIESVYASFLGRFDGKSDDPRAVAQEWIPGPNSRFAKLYVVCDHEGRVIAHHTLRRVRVQIRKDGSQGDTLVAKTELVPELIERWLPFFQTLGWVGVASMECKYDERDGEYKIVEINPRPWAILKISVDCGVDVPLLYYLLARGERLEPRQGFTENRYYIRLLWGNIDPPEPWRVLGMLFTRRISLGEVLSVYVTLLRNWPRLSIDVGRVRDPWPTIACLYYYGIRYFSRWF